MVFEIFDKDYCFEWLYTNRSVTWNDIPFQQYSPELPQPPTNNDDNDDHHGDPHKSSSCHLRVGLYPNEVVMFGQKTFICTEQYEILMILLRHLNCSLKFVVSEQDFGGFLADNGTWTGILNLMDTKRIDFVAHPFSTNHDRKKLLDQTFVIPNEDLLTILSHEFSANAQHNQDDSFGIFRVFSPQIWTIIMLHFVLMSLAMFTLWNELILANDRCFGHHQDHQSQTLPKQLARLVHCHLSMYAFSMGQDITNLKNQLSTTTTTATTVGVMMRANYMIKFATNKLRYPLIIWIFCSILLRQLFSFDILTKLVLDEDGEKIDYFDQLLHIAFGAFDASPANIVDANDGEMKKNDSSDSPTNTEATRLTRLSPLRIFIQRDSNGEKVFLERYPQLRPFLLRLEHEEAYEVKTVADLIQGNHVLILSRFNANLMQKVYEHIVDLHVSHEGFVSTLSAIAIRKDLQQRERSILMRLSRTIYSSGLNLIFRERWIHYNLMLVRRQHWMIRNDANNNENDQNDLNDLNDPKDATQLQLAPKDNDCPEHDSQESCSNIRLTLLNVATIGYITALTCFLIELLVFLLVKKL